jgi:hypothetical protein
MDSNTLFEIIQVDRTRLDILVITDDGKVAAPYITVLIETHTNKITHSVITFPEDTDQGEPARPD